jgi:hypothetical protein
MGTTTKTDYMLLVLPLPSQAPGPAWASLLNDALFKIDRHNHTPDNGNPIVSAAIKIDSALSFQGNDAILLRSARLANQATALGGATDLGCIYEAGGDLWWNSAAGDQVQLTSGAGLNAASIGAIGGDFATTPGAAVSLVAASKKFIFWSGANTPGAIDCGPVTLRTLTASPHGVTLNSPAALAADYGVTMPAGLPAASRLVTLDNNGALAAPETALGAGLTLTGALAAGGGAAVTGNVAASGNVVVDTAGANAGTIANTLRFAAANGGEGIGNKRTAGGNQFGLDFYTFSTARLSIAQGGAIDCHGNAVNNVATPSVSAGAANKGYVDSKFIAAAHINSDGTVGGQSGSVTLSCSRGGPGTYVVTIPGLGQTTGVVQVSTANGSVNGASGAFAVMANGQVTVYTWVLGFAYGLSYSDAPFSLTVARL